MEQNDTDSKRLISKLGLALSLMAISTLASQFVISSIVYNVFPGLYNSSLYGFALTAVSVVGVGFPVFYAATKNIPDSDRGEKLHLKLSYFIGIFFVCAAFMYLANFLGAFVNYLISELKGGTVVNPIEDAISNSNIIMNIAYVSLLGPIVEEIIFRGILLNKLRRFGDLPAILLSGFAFGFFHMNLSQFFYAAALGFIFAYVTIRTNTLKYSIILHIMINSIGSVITPLAAYTQNKSLNTLLGLWVIGSIVIGSIIFFKNIKGIVLYRASEPTEVKIHYVGNPGVIIFLLICIAMMVFVILS